MIIKGGCTDVVLKELRSFVARYELMHLRNNIDEKIVSRNKAIVNDFLESFETFKRNE